MNLYDVLYKVLNLSAIPTGLYYLAETGQRCIAFPTSVIYLRTFPHDRGLGILSHGSPKHRKDAHK